MGERAIRIPRFFHAAMSSILTSCHDDISTQSHAREAEKFTTEKFKFHSFSIIHFIISYLIKFHSHTNSWFGSRWNVERMNISPSSSTSLLPPSSVLGIIFGKYLIWRNCLGRTAPLWSSLTAGWLDSAVSAAAAVLLLSDGNWTHFELLRMHEN